MVAWSNLLWLAVDMNMGGMHMTGFRMVAAGVGIMAQVSAPRRMIEFAFVFVIWLVMMVGMMAPSAAGLALLRPRENGRGDHPGYRGPW